MLFLGGHNFCGICFGVIYASLVYTWLVDVENFEFLHGKKNH